MKANRTMRRMILTSLLFPAVAVLAAPIVVDSPTFRLTVGEDAIVRSLIVKETGEECLSATEPTALFSVTQDRPFNNELKLIEPTRETTWQADSLRREGDLLVAGFPHRQYEAVVRLRTGAGYAAFELVDFRCDRTSTYDYLKMDVPPVASFRVLLMPLENLRRHPRTGDVLETMRRWNDARRRGFVTDAWRAKLRDLSREHHLLQTPDGGYELVEWRQIAVGAPDVRAFLYERGGRTHVAYWHTCGEGTARILLPGETAPRVLACGGVKTLSVRAPARDAEAAFAKAR